MAVALPEEPGERLRGLIERLEMLRPVARELGVALGVASAGELHWLDGHTACECSRLIDGPDVYSRVASAGLARIPVPGGGGTVWLCPGPASPETFAALQEMVRAVLREIDLAAEHEPLLNELAACWESLDTLYQFSADVREVHETGELLNRIVERAVQFVPGLRAVLWIDNQGMLEAAASGNTPAPPARPVDGGLIGKTMRSRHTMVANGRAAVAALADREAELAEAISLLITPVGGPDSVPGALAVWHDFQAVEFDSPRIRLIEGLAAQASAVISSDRYLRASLESARMKNEFEIGATIQRLLLFKEPPRDFPGLRIGSAMISSREIDGDFCEYIPLSRNCLDIVIGDVMGKGLPAALVGAATKNEILRAVGGLLVALPAGELPPPAEIVNLVHAAISPRLIESERFVTLCYARIDLPGRRLLFVDCGHTRTVHRSGATGLTQFLQGENVALGVLQREVYEQRSVPLGNGDILVFYSDGVTEAKSPDGTLYGEDRLAECVRNNGDRTPDEFIRSLRASLGEFTQADSFSDDLTCVAVRVTGLDPAASRHAVRFELPGDLQQITPLRRQLRAVYAQAAQRDELGFHLLELAVVEAFTNVVRHALPGFPHPVVRIEAEVLPDAASISLYHSGKAFDPETAPSPAFDGSRQGGFGLHLIAQAVDQVVYSRDPRGENRIQLVKNFPPIQSGENEDASHR